MNGRSLTEGTPWKQVLLFALPVFAGILLQQLYNTVDTLIVGNFESEAALSAVGTTGCLTFFLLAIANGFSAGAGVIVARLFGAQKQREMRETASTALLLLLGLGVVSTFAGLALSRPVLQYVLAVPPAFLDMAIVYFRIYALGMIFQFGYNIAAALLRAVGDSKATLLFLAIASLLNIVLDLLFVALLRWGVAGAAIATGIAQAASCAAAFLYMWKRYPLFRFKLAELHFDASIAADVLRTGFPMALQQMIVSFGFLFIQRAVNSYGQAMTASFTVAQKMETYIITPGNAFQITMANFTGQNIGAKKPERVKLGAKQTLLMCELVTLVICALMFLFAGQIVQLFGLSKQAAAYCVEHLRVMSFLILILTGYFPLFGVFQGAGNGFAATIVALAALSMRVIVTYMLCYLPLFGYRIIWWNQLFGFSLGFCITWTHFLRGKWLQNATRAERAA